MRLWVMDVRTCQSGDGVEVLAISFSEDDLNRLVDGGLASKEQEFQHWGVRLTLSISGARYSIV